MADRRTVIKFEGTLHEFVTFLDSWGPRNATAHEWELSACISRHPAGKGLGVSGIERAVHPGPDCGCTPCELRTSTGWWDTSLCCTAARATDGERHVVGCANHD